MATDPNIILAAGQINDPYRMAQAQAAQLQLQQQQQAMRGQNALKAVFAQPGAMSPDGQVSANALAQIMRVDPQTGLDLAKQNRAAMIDQLHIKAAELGNQLSQTEIGKAKWDFITTGAAVAANAYDAAIRAGATPQMAAAAATRARDAHLATNGGQISQDEEQQFKSRPFNIDDARALASQNKDYVVQTDKDRSYQLREREDAETERHDRVTEEQGNWAVDPNTGKLYNKRTGEEGGPGGAGPDGTMPAPRDAIAYVIDRHEGGWNPRDTNSTPTMWGINYASNAGILRRFGINSPDDLKNLTKEQAEQIYAEKYPIPTSIKTDAGRAVYFDVAVRSPQLAQYAYQKSGGDIGQFVQIASGEFQRMAARNPAKYGRFAQAWRNRDSDNAAIARGVTSGGTGTTGGLTNDALDEVAWQTINNGGKVPPGFSRNRQMTVAVNNRVAEIMKRMGMNAQDVAAFGANIAASKGALTSLDKQAATVEAAERSALGAIKVVTTEYNKIQNKSIPKFNQFRNYLNTNVGNPNATGAAAAMNTLVNEYARVVGGGQPTDALREHAREMLNAAQSPQQFQEAINVLTKDMEYRRKGFSEERKVALGRIRHGENYTGSDIAVDEGGSTSGFRILSVQ